MEIIIGFICTAIGFAIGYFVQVRKHKEELDILAADSSWRIQTLTRELAIVVLESDSEAAQEITLRLRLNQTATKMAETTHPEMSPVEEHIYEINLKNL